MSNPKNGNTLADSLEVFKEFFWILKTMIKAAKAARRVFVTGVGMTKVI